MRKQITIPNSLNPLIKEIANHSDVSESAVICYAINFLHKVIANCKGDVELMYFLKTITSYYRQVYIKQLPRGKKAKEVNNEKKT